MQKSVNKATIIVLVLLSLVLVAGASAHKASSVGRFQLVVSPSDSQYAYVIDTTTGEVWGKTDGRKASGTDFNSKKISTVKADSKKKDNKPLD